MKRRIPRALVRTVVACVVLAVVAWGAWLWMRPAQVTTAAVTERELSPAIQGIGTVEAKVVVQLAAKVTGTIVAIHVDQGDAVTRGQLLIELENSESKAEFENAVANLERSKLAFTAQQAALRKAQAGITAAEAAVAKAKANRDLARSNEKRWRRLAESGVVPQSEVDERATVAETASEEFRSAEALREVAMRDVSALQVAVDIAESDIAAAAAAGDAARARRAYAAIESPVDGFVVSRELEVGAAVNPGTPILKIADPSTTWVTVFVDERDTGPITLGGPAEISLRSMPGRTFEGSVARIRRESDRVTEQMAVDIAFGEAPERLTLGEQAEASIRPPTRRAVAIPVSSVVRTPEGTGAWTVVDGRLRFRPIRFGLVDPAGWIEVIEGVEIDQTVVVSPGKLADPSNEGRAVLAVARTDSDKPAERP